MKEEKGQRANANLPGAGRPHKLKYILGGGPSKREAGMPVLIQ